MADPAPDIPASLFDGGRPGIIEDPDRATQDDFTRAYVDTYTAWEGCAANLARIQSLAVRKGAVK